MRPNGIHLCQGLLLGEDARNKPLADIFAAFDPARHPICSALDEGGPAGLARFAVGYGFEPRPRYADGCQLCFDARRHLQRHFPELVGPAEVYVEPSEGEGGEVLNDEGRIANVFVTTTRT